MQVFGLPGQIIGGASVATRIAARVLDGEPAIRRDAVARWRAAMRGGLDAGAAAKAVGVSRATLYRREERAEARSRRPLRVRERHGPSALVRAVERSRADFPVWGRAKLGPHLRAEGLVVSDMTVGRIVASLVARGACEPVPIARRAAKTKRWSARRHWARRLPKGPEPDKPGGIVRIDTVFVQLAPQSHFKHFTAHDPVARWTVAKAFRRATATAATEFLAKTLADIPFPADAIQVDGGSEVRAEFEQACEDNQHSLHELPPKRPQLNGGFECCNAAWRSEFYAVHDLPTRVDELNPFIDGFQHLYNNHRPHGALGGQTPASNLAARTAEASASHMS